MSVESWIEFWRDYDYTDQISSRDRFHTSDREVLNRWAEYGERFIDEWPERGRLEGAERGMLHRCLRPVPFVGNLQSATIILAMLNPTVGPKDYDDNRNPQFISLLRANSRQDHSLRCFAVDPTHPQNAWASYYVSKFRRVVQRAIELKKGSEAQIWEALQVKLAVLELVPYYSADASLLFGSCLQCRLPSARIALSAVEDLQKRDRLIIPAWSNGAERWGLPRAGLDARMQRGGFSNALVETICERL